ncbi:MAG: hypothetical protein AAGC68_16775, partial [Verrucomicrobiota bacterium]
AIGDRWEDRLRFVGHSLFRMLKPNELDRRLKSGHELPTVVAAFLRPFRLVGRIYERRKSISSPVSQ